VVRIGLVAFGVGFILMSKIDSVVAFYAVFLLIAVGSALGGFLTVNIVLVNWFERRRAQAMAFASMGNGFSGLLVPFIALGLTTFGWRDTALYSGILVLLIGLPVSHLIRHAPEPFGWAPDGARPTMGPRSSPQSGATTIQLAGGLSASEALHTSSFWLLTLGHTSALVLISALGAHLIPYLVQDVQMSVEEAARVVAMLTGLSIAGQIVGGFAGDRMDKRTVAIIGMVGHTLALILLITGDPTLILGFAALQGICWGMRGPLMMAIRADYFGRRAFATIEGFASVVTTAGLVAGPLIVGSMADAFGNYRLGFGVLAIATIAGSVAFAAARRPVAV
ncbi:MAG: transporter, partial [Chloroflexi bacterium]|nr:transporter [Chloroflexota bacterium]